MTLDNDRHWVFPLSFCDPRIVLPNNRNQSLQSVRSLDRSIEKYTVMQPHALDFMQKMIDNGYAEVAPSKQKLNTPQTCFWVLKSTFIASFLLPYFFEQRYLQLEYYLGGCSRGCPEHPIQHASIAIPCSGHVLPFPPTKLLQMENMTTIYVSKPCTCTCRTMNICNTIATSYKDTNMFLVP